MEKHVNKKKALFLTVHRKDRSPSQRFRFEQYIDFLEHNGFECKHFYLIGEKEDKVFYAKGRFVQKAKIVLQFYLRLLKLLRTEKNIDICFIQREAFVLGTTFFERKFSKRARMIFDFDDSIWLQNVSDANKKFVFLKNANKTVDLIRISDVVFAGNQYLADFALKHNQNVVIVPTTIDTNEYFPVSRKKENEKITIGWSGSITTIQHFNYALPVLRRIVDKYGDRVAIKVIGDGNYVNKELGIQGLPWRKETEIEELCSFDIGIMPLPDDEWAKGKCGLKGLQYMALAIPTIMSPVGVNTEIIRDGENGFLAAAEEEWISKISALIENSELRDNIGKEGRNTVVSKFSVIAWEKEYLKHFQSLIS